MTRKIFVMLVALIGFGICANAQQDSDNSVNLFDLKISTQGGIVEKINLETDIYDNVYRNCYKLGYHPWRGDTYIEFVLNKKYKYFSVTLVVPQVEKASEIFVEIMGDSKILYKSQGLTQKTRAKEIVLDVSGQDFIRINVAATDYGLAVLLANGKVYGNATKDNFVVDEKPVEQTETSVLINGVRWATRNVDKPGTFAAKPENAGMFYQWGSNVGWSSMNPITATDGNNIWRNLADNGSTWLSAKDPCPPGWRVPTISEWQSLVDAGSSWTTVNGVSGRVFGSAPNTIFLSAVPGRVIDGRLDVGVNSVGYYWSSTPYNSDGIYRLNFRSGGATSIMLDLSSRADGRAVRCVKE